ncbi:unnamed protein product [Zymoseptoria tritici ST99CH_1A5]|uniref:CENP-V/GFA domain-containing protein n=1 Tax=Zymoseptoria tritici ST99CH_1A5 TaxID=1276529 RepID=A0A1Y6L2M7_ZYMTR|nr:unnamed protein product [Zymoseptoria tritici ST99CH_1A5]
MRIGTPDPLLQDRSPTILTVQDDPKAYLYVYHGDSGNTVNCYYCPHCTTHMYHHQEVMGPDTIVVWTGWIKEGREKFEVGAEIFGKAKMDLEPKIAETFETLSPS